MRYSAFISYNHRDRRWANWLHRELEHYRLPKALLGRDSPIGILERKLPPVFQDREELAASPNLAESVREALTDSANLIIICSTNAVQSRWVNEEIRVFAAMGRRDRIQWLIVPEKDNSELADAAIFPAAFFEIGGEALAADVRKSGDGKRNAFLKLVAGLTQVRFDELRQRDQMRRARRLIGLATAAGAGFLLMSALALYAFIARSEAIRDRDIARQKSITAERTTDFVKGLFEVSDPSEARGQSITAAEVLDRGARRIDASLTDEPDVKAELMSTLGEVFIGLGSYLRADALIRRSLMLKVGNPETRARQLAVAGNSQALQGEYQRSVAFYDQALAQIDQIDRFADSPIRSRLLVAKAESFASLEKYADADRLIQQALRIDQRRDGANSVSVARGLEAAGLTNQFAGKYALASAQYKRALAIRTRAQGQLHPKVSEDLNELGTIAYMQNDPGSAEQYWKQSLSRDQQVLGPAHPDLAATFNNLGRVLLEQRKYAEALPILRRSASISLAQRTETHDDMAFIFANLALATSGIGDDDDAE
ncbi:MAG: toll/interleukin-1 receptor domain-containing protein, partial [Sphingomonas bacterium]|nr:toll/interleukin-1 receptor domain-containing protein [Sphingomonas bacterium]